jgi:hypothetical protein
LKRCEWYDVPHYWPQVEALIKAALAHGSIAWAPTDIYAMLLARQMQLWLALSGEEVVACAVTRIDAYPQAKVCALLLIGGTELDSWLHFSDDIAAWAKGKGCDAMEGPGRRGWERKARHLGWRPVWTVYRKMLDDQTG